MGKAAAKFMGQSGPVVRGMRGRVPLLLSYLIYGTRGVTFRVYASNT
jgi:hypothetical protein